jgi:hypothetical protein
MPIAQPDELAMHRHLTRRDKNRVTTSDRMRGSVRFLSGHQFIGQPGRTDCLGSPRRVIAARQVALLEIADD